MPVAEHEVYLTYELADATWCMRRVNRYEAGLLSICENQFDDAKPGVIALPSKVSTARP